MIKISKEQDADENQALLNDKKRSPNINDQYQRQSSRLEWSQSSWTRLLHVLCWTWLNPIISLGSKQQLTENDLDDVPHIDRISILSDRLQSYDWSSKTTWTIVNKEFRKDYMFATILYFPFLITCIALPLLLHQFLLNTIDKQGSNTANYLYVIALVLSVILQSITERQAVFCSTRVAMRIRNSLIITIYKRSLSLKSTSWEQMNTGQIINLIAQDTSKFEEMYTYLPGLCGTLIETIIIFGLVWWMINLIPALCCFAAFSIFIFIQFYLSRKFGECRERTALFSDERVQAFSEFIYGCHIVKMYNWEKPIEDRITKMRENELESIRHTSRFRALISIQYFISSPILALITFGSAWFLGYPLNTANTFPVLLFFASIRNNAMYYLPRITEKLSEAKIASKRIDSFMHLIMIQKHQFPLSTSSINQQKKGSISISNAFFSWSNEIPCLLSLNINIEQGTFVGIVGPVGSGKSSLLAAILNEINLIHGELNTHDSSFSYAAQSPWIFADTFRNNILLNRPFDEQRYRNIIYGCCLDVDLSQFGSSGDLMIIGEKGVNLSGGQKARVSLARALYADADIYLLDDPLSSVDLKVAKQIYERCIGPHGLLKNKTRLLVTHQTQFVKETHQIIFLSQGHIDKRNYFNENLIKEDHTDKNETTILSDMLDENTSMPDTQSIITDETALTNNAKRYVWYHLFIAPPSGTVGCCLLIVLLVLGQVLTDGSNYSFAIWLKRLHRDEQSSSNLIYIYFGLIVSAVFVDILRTNYFYTIVLHGANSLHNNMLRGLLHTSIQFFESNPSGRILNRVSKDQYVTDEILPMTLLNSVKGLLSVGGSMIIICLTNPFLIPLFIVLIPIFWWMYYSYHRSSRQFKQIENITRSSVYALFVSSLNGLSTIRAFKAENSFIQLISDRIDMNTSACILVQAATEWFALRFTAVCSLIVLATSISLVLFRNGIDSPIGALGILSALYISLGFQFTARKFSEADILMTSAERIDEYSHLPSEEDEDNCKNLVETSPNWPFHGTIEFRNYSLRHRVNLQYAIRNINVKIESGQKIGIIGRTGAGKSSLFKGIFRFIDRSDVNGEILIDDVDISRITINQLRSHLTTIPQQSILFSGTLRYNLDPFNSYSDEQCWKALEDVQLKQFVRNHSAGLLMSISERGNNLSVGQCQLISIARAILKKSKILLIDEATASVDQQTDDFIQSVINDKFHDRTVLTIAHRLNTVARCDRILVLDNGIIVNYDTSTNILDSYNQ